MVEMKPERWINDKISKHATVQAYLDELTFAMFTTATELLVQTKHDGDSQIAREKGDVDWYVILSDERGQKAALSIEYGHAEYTTRYRAKNGHWYEVTVPASEGTFILTRATGIQRLGHAPKGLD